MFGKLIYQAPSLLGLSSFQPIAFAQTGQGDANDRPSNPNPDCGNASCDRNEGPDTFAIQVSWNDDPSTDVCAYTVKVSMSPDGGEYSLRDEDCASGISGCNVTEIPDINPANNSQYVLNCSGVDFTGSGCFCEPNTINVISISDGVNSLSVNEDCAGIDVGGIGC